MLLDEFEEIPFRVPRRVCAKRGCKADARAGGGRLCRACHAIATRNWRHLRKSEAPPRTKSASSSSPAVARRVALKRAIERGDITRGECIRGLGHAGVVAIFGREPTPGATGKDRFEGLIWICRACLHDFRNSAAEDARARQAEAQATIERHKSAARIENALAELERLTPQKRAEIEALAARGPAGLRLAPTSPLYQQRLAKLLLDEKP